MARRKWESLSPDLILSRIKEAGFSKSNKTETKQRENPVDLDARIEAILNLTTKNISKNTMVYLVMYDIENNKVRTLISKYLESQGCTRIQNSVFIANTTKEKLESIEKDLASVQASYENDDSIIVTTLSQVNFDTMRVIGKKLNMEIAKNKKKFLFV